MAWFDDLSPCSYFGDEFAPFLARSDGWKVASLFRWLDEIDEFSRNYVSYARILGSLRLRWDRTHATCANMTPKCMDRGICLFLAASFCMSHRH